MKKPTMIIKTLIGVNNSVEGETIEQQVKRLLENNEPTEGEAALVYTERKEGVRAETNIRTDRFEIAIDAMDKVSGSYRAKREERLELEKKKSEEERGEGSQGRAEGGQANKK